MAFDEAALTEQSDGELIARARQGDQHAFGELVRRYWEGVAGLVYRMYGDLFLAEDAAQTAFLRGWQRLDTYQPRYPFRNWIYSIALHSAIDQLRRNREALPLENAPLRASEPGPEQSLEASERANAVQQAILDLSPASRAVIVLREYENMSYAEISDVLNIPLGTVMSRLSYARNQLRQKLVVDERVR